MAITTRERGESSNTRERGESSNTRERGESSNRRERGEPSNIRERGESSNRRERGESSNRRERGEPSNIRERGELSSIRERGESSNTRERGESSNTRERGELSSIRERGESSSIIERGSESSSNQNEGNNQNPAGNNEVQLPGRVTFLTCYTLSNGTFRSMAAGKNGQLYTGADQSTSVKCWNYGRLIGRFPVESAACYAILLDESLSRVYVGGSDGKVRVVEIELGSRTAPGRFRRHEDLPWLESRRKKKAWKKKIRVLGWKKRRNWRKYPITCMSFSEVSENINPMYLYTGSTDCSVKVWSLRDSLIVDCLKKHKDIVGAVAAGCDGRMFSASQDGFLHMWLRKQNGTDINKISHTLINTLLSGTVPINALLLKSTTTGFATEAGNSELYAGLSDGRVLVWKERFDFSSSEMETLRGHDDAVTCVACSPGGDLVLAGARNGIVCGWNTEIVTKKHTLMLKIDTNGGLVHCIAAQEDFQRNMDGSWSCILYTGSDDMKLRTWRIWFKIDNNAMPQIGC